MLPQSFYNRDTLTVARELLGCFICRHLTPTSSPYKGEGNYDAQRYTFIRYRIVETEGYCGPDDLASHASRGRTPRTDVMFGPPGHAYIYLVYGMHHMFNIVTEREGYPAAILIRAVEPLQHATTLPATNGPARLTKALSIDQGFNNLPVFKKEYGLWIEAGETAAVCNIVAAPRVGIAYAKEYKDKPWRFFIKNNPYVSKI